MRKTLLLAAVLLPAATRAAEAAEPAPLAVLWRASLGPSDRLVYRAAVCPDGTVFLADSGGRVAAISAEGKVISDRRTPIGPPLAAACKRTGELVLASRGAFGAPFLHTVSSDPSRPPNSVPLRTGDEVAGPVHAMTLTDDDTAILVLSEPATRSVRLAFVDGTGDVIKVTDPMPEDSRTIGDAGSVLWDPARRQVIYVRSSRYTFQAYDRTGVPLGGHDLGARLDVTASEHVRGVVRLPSGQLVVQIAGMTRSTRVRDAWKPRARLEMLSGDLGPLAAVEDGGPGLLIGADDAGHLYFQDIVRDGETTIVKARWATE